jgi:hypothetical protein
MREIREQLAQAVERFDESLLPPRFADARARLGDALARLESDGVRDEALIAALVNETLPRLLARHGLLGTGAILRRIADGIDPQPPADTGRRGRQMTASQKLTRAQLRELRQELVADGSLPGELVTEAERMAELREAADCDALRIRARAGRARDRLGGALHVRAG